MTCSKSVSNPSPECFGNADAFILQTHTKLHTEKVLFSKVPQNYFFDLSLYFLLLYCCALSWINVVLHSVSMSTLTIMVNLWWCFSLPVLSPSSTEQLPHTAPSHSSLSLFLSAVASQDRAIVADRRRVGSINRNWTNYKADVPLYDGGRTLSVGSICGTFTISLSSCSLLFYSLFPSLSMTVLFLWLRLPSSFRLLSQCF